MKASENYMMKYFLAHNKFEIPFIEKLKLDIVLKNLHEFFII